MHLGEEHLPVGELYTIFRFPKVHSALITLLAEPLTADHTVRVGLVFHHEHRLLHQRIHQLTFQLIVETVGGFREIKVLKVLVFGDAVGRICDEIHPVHSIWSTDDVVHIDEFHPEFIVGGNLYRRFGKTDTDNGLLPASAKR